MFSNAPVAYLLMCMDLSMLCLLCNFLQRNLADWISFAHWFFSAVSIYSTACMKLEEYETAKVALEKGASLAPGDSRFTNLIKECEERIAGMHLTSIRWSHSLFIFYVKLLAFWCKMLYISVGTMSFWGELEIKIYVLTSVHLIFLVKDFAFSFQRKLVTYKSSLWKQAQQMLCQLTTSSLRWTFPQLRMLRQWWMFPMRLRWLHQPDQNTGSKY